MRCTWWKTSAVALWAAIVCPSVRGQAPYPTAAPYAASGGPTLAAPAGQPIPTPVVTSAQGGYTAPSGSYGGAPPGAPNFTSSAPPASYVPSASYVPAPPSAASPIGAPYGSVATPYSAAPSGTFTPATAGLRGPTSFPGQSAAASYGSAPVRQFNQSPLLASNTQPAVPTLAPSTPTPAFQPGPYNAPPPGTFGGGPLGTTTGYAGSGPVYAGPGGGASPYGGCDPCTAGGACGPCGPCYNWYDYLTIFSAIDAFKGPLDLDGLNGNFGKRVGVNLALPLYAPWGLGAQIGSSAGWYDYKGTLYTGSGDRFQNFSTVGIFQRSPMGLNWGAVYDFMIDDYYSNFRFEQIRGAISYNWNPWNELGVWMSIPQKKDSAVVGAPPVNNTFEPLMQGAVYWQHAWNDGAWTRAHVGLAEQPGDIVWGSSSQVAINDFAALTGGFHYVLPSAGGNTGREEEMWNVSVGVTFFPGSARRAATSPLAPLLPMADNGNFGVWRRQ